MRPVGLAAIRAGLVSEEAMEEMHRWGMLPRDVTEPPDTVDPEQAIIFIQEALEAEDQVSLKKTDLDILRVYLGGKNQHKGRMVIIDPDTEAKSSKNVAFCKMPGKRYVIPWLSDSALDLLVNNHSYLSYREEGDEKPRRVYFLDVRELYFGDVKAFMVLEESSVESG